MVDLMWQRFGMLTVIGRADRPPHVKDRSLWWVCKCDCGNTISTSGLYLKQGNKKSCGCIKATNGGRNRLIHQLQDENAQQARCIENMTDKLNAMNDEVAKLQAERDAMASELVGTCQVCRWEETAKCASCHFCEHAWNAYESNWEWRGVQKEE